MEGVAQLQRQLVDYSTSLFQEGFLDNQFTQLQQLQDESNPDFVVEVVNLFFEDSERLLNELTKALDQPSVDFKKVDSHVHQLKGTLVHKEFKMSALPSATTVRSITLKGNCLNCLQQVKEEYSLVKNKLETLFKLEQQLLAAGGSVALDEMQIRTPPLQREPRTW
ncbi:Signal transduction histidine kinase, phosphotransfer (Hpt) domain [Dillenia turbinata]|uniref:Histidine-containing phosphotransfer protein n=1 Tax=Dillenia turbinata TaxID=194707 RepID=A0AAN8YZR9_9MAGN